MSIQIASYKGHYSCHGCNFYAKENELIVTADYQRDFLNATDKMPLKGWNSSSIYKFVDMSEKAIREAITQEYGEEVARSGVCLLGIPQLVMKFVLS